MRRQIFDIFHSHLSRKVLFWKLIVKTTGNQSPLFRLHFIQSIINFKQHPFLHNITKRLVIHDFCKYILIVIHSFDQFVQEPIPKTKFKIINTDLFLNLCPKSWFELRYVVWW